MKEIELIIKIRQPDIHDYEELYPRIPCNSEQKKAIFRILTLPANIQAALVVAEETGSSPVTVHESKLQAAIERGDIQPLSWHEKQFVGTVTAVIMEFNGFEKTSKKQRFTKGLFKSAELYCRQQVSA
ncbi:hypothetical protein LRS11_12515 [Pseudomonas sp. J452]|uniref:hypothetical protein n=1 Tax=Pseudomonas sp. J452 TaxID=2898441 RepID=UPI0021ADD3F6|nr:hypothetical protein [Pseudomonas sp. J452]UUY06684.1 hypothetical protein LRS11_12515 [Pseudomonas sp. J452]